MKKNRSEKETGQKRDPTRSAAAMIIAQKKGDDDGEREGGKEKREEERAVKGLTKLGSGKRRKGGREPKGDVL